MSSSAHLHQILSWRTSRDAVVAWLARSARTTSWASSTSTTRASRAARPMTFLIEQSKVPGPHQVVAPTNGRRRRRNPPPRRSGPPQISPRTRRRTPSTRATSPSALNKIFGIEVRARRRPTSTASRTTRRATSLLFFAESRSATGDFMAAPAQTSTCCSACDARLAQNRQKCLPYPARFQKLQRHFRAINRRRMNNSVASGKCSSIARRRRRTAPRR